MKISVLLNVVLALAVVILSVKLVKSSGCEASEHTEYIGEVVKVIKK